MIIKNLLLFRNDVIKSVLWDGSGRRRAGELTRL
jgi:hypothetical protein